MLYTYVFNRLDDGTPPRKPSELSAKQATSVHLEFIMPNLWQNYISPDVRILAAFVPVDEAHTLLYLRFYQRFLTLPVLGKLVAKLAMPANLRIAHEDRRVVVTHQPQISDLKIGEALIQGDLPIIEYRRKRAELAETGRPDRMTSIWWIRRDLRLTDNRPLQAAIKTGAVFPVFILDPRLLSQPAARRHSFLFEGLHALDKDLRARGSYLILREGEPLGSAAKTCRRNRRQFHLR